VRTTIRITYIRLAGRYHIDEVGGDGVVRAELHPAWIDDRAFAEHLAGLVAGYRRLGASVVAVDEDGVVWERGRRGPEQRRVS
jgi:hypothetical protein